MRIRRWTLTVWGACALMTASCAGSPEIVPAAPPRLTLPDSARTPCALYTLPEAATQVDLEAGYMIRGGQIAACDAARALAVQTLDAERALADRLQASREARARPWWRWW